MLNYLVRLFFICFLSRTVHAQQTYEKAIVENDTLLKFNAPAIDGYITYDLGYKSDFNTFDVLVIITNISKTPVQLPAALIVWYDTGIMTKSDEDCQMLFPGEKTIIPLTVHSTPSRKRMHRQGIIPVLTYNHRLIYYPMGIRLDYY